jgi:hypothetical protein
MSCSWKSVKPGDAAVLRNLPRDISGKLARPSQNTAVLTPQLNVDRNPYSNTPAELRVSNFCRMELIAGTFLFGRRVVRPGCVRSGEGRSRDSRSVGRTDIRLATG